jgi:hypothetical protein
MPDSHASHAAHEPHPWAEMTPDEVLDALVYELYTPVSALGNEVDRLSTGAFEDEELMRLLEQMREGVNHLSKLVVMLKRYTAERHNAAPEADPQP